MAFLMKRWPWTLLVAALVIAVAYLPPQRPEEPDPYRGQWQSFPTPESRLAKRLGDDYLRMADHQRTVRVRDSLMSVLSSRKARGGSVTALSPRRDLDSLAGIVARAATPAVPRLSPDVRAVFAFVPSAPAEFDATYNAYLPAGTDGRTCIATQPVALNRERPSVRPRQVLGPCAFFSAFGLPGRQVERWLASRGYDVALDPDWQLPRHTPQPPVQASAAQWVQFTLSRFQLAPRPDDYWELDGASMYWGSLTGSACASGNRGACRQYFFSPLEEPVRRRGTSIPGVIEFRPWWSYQEYGALATLVRDQGPDRFAKFWRSDLPPEQAFDQAFTVPFDQWAPAWARTAYGPVRTGVHIRLSEFAVTVLWIGLCVGACVVLALTRRVA